MINEIRVLDPRSLNYHLTHNHVLLGELYISISSWKHYKAVSNSVLYVHEFADFRQATTNRLCCFQSTEIFVAHHRGTPAKAWRNTRNQVYISVVLIAQTFSIVTESSHLYVLRPLDIQRSSYASCAIWVNCFSLVIHLIEQLIDHLSSTHACSDGFTLNFFLSRNINWIDSWMQCDMSCEMKVANHPNLKPSMWWIRHGWWMDRWV